LDPIRIEPGLWPASEAMDHSAGYSVVSPLEYWYDRVVVRKTMGMELSNPLTRHP